MTAKNIKIVQYLLISIGFLLIVATYFYPKIVENKLLKDETFKKDNMIETDSETRNTFEDVEYRGLYNIDTPFTVKSKKAHVLKSAPNLVYMTNVHVSLSTNDGRIIIITSLEGRYDTQSYDLFFEKNVKAVDGKTTVLAENLDLIANESATAYNDVFFTNEDGSLQADKVDYNFETKHYQISMFSNEKVKIKLIK